MGSDVGSHVCVGRVTVVSMWGNDVGSHVWKGQHYWKVYTSKCDKCLEDAI